MKKNYAIVKYCKNPYISTLNFEGQAAANVGYLMITSSNIRLLDS